MSNWIAHIHFAAKYYILVHGFGNNVGDFEVEIETLDPVENDDCGASQKLELGEAEDGSNFAASLSEVVPECGTNETTLGVWYTVEGTGGVLQATLNETVVLDLSLYSGDCDALSCMMSQESSYHPIDWPTNEGEDYYLYVYGVGANEKDEFSIIVEEVTRPENDECEEAMILELNGRPMDGTTRISQEETEVEFCGDAQSSGYGGVWYTFTSEFEALVLVGVTNSEPANPLEFPLDSQINVYTGGCDGLTCVDGNDESSIMGYSSAVVMNAEAGEEYHVLVRGWELTRGDFKIEVKGVIRPPNNACASATFLEGKQRCSSAVRDRIIQLTPSFSF